MTDESEVTTRGRPGRPTWQQTLAKSKAKDKAKMAKVRGRRKMKRATVQTVRT